MVPYSVIHTGHTPHASERRLFETIAYIITQSTGGWN